MNTKRWLSACLLLTFLFTLGLSTSLVRAEVPTVVSWSISGNALHIMIKHPGSSSTHYVDKVEISIYWETDVSDPDTGEWVVEHFTDTLDVPYHTSETFSVGYNLGEIPFAAIVDVRVHCTVDGWSSHIRVPEFSLIPVVLLFAILTVSVVLLKSFTWKKL